MGASATLTGAALRIGRCGPPAPPPTTLPVQHRGWWLPGRPPSAGDGSSLPACACACEELTWGGSWGGGGWWMGGGGGNAMGRVARMVPTLVQHLPLLLFLRSPLPPLVPPCRGLPHPPSRATTAGGLLRRGGRGAQRPRLRLESSDRSPDERRGGQQRGSGCVETEGARQTQGAWGRRAHRPAASTGATGERRRGHAWPRDQPPGVLPWASSHPAVLARGGASTAAGCGRPRCETSQWRPARSGDACGTSGSHPRPPGGKRGQWQCGSRGGGDGRRDGVDGCEAALSPRSGWGAAETGFEGPIGTIARRAHPPPLPPRHWGGWSGSWGWSAEPPPSGPRRTRRRSWRFGCCPCCTFTVPAARPRTGAPHGGEKWAEKGAGGGHGRELPPHTPIPYCEGLTAAARRAVGMPGTLSPTSMTHYLIS